MDPEEQRRIDEEARAAGAAAEERALAQLETADLTGAATGAPAPSVPSPTPRHVDLGGDLTPFTDEELAGGPLASRAVPPTVDTPQPVGIADAGSESETGPATQSSYGFASPAVMPTPEAAAPSALGTPSPSPEAPPAESPDALAGLPTEAEIDAERRREHPFLHRLGQGFLNAASIMAGGGPHTPTPFESHADAMQEERRAGIRQALQQRGLLARQESQDALAQQRLALQARGVAAQEAMIPARIAQTEASAERTRAQTEADQLATQFSRATREERQSAESGLSRGYQEAVRTRAELTGIDVPEDLDQQSAEALEPQLRAMMQGVGVRRGRGGGGGDRQAVIDELVRRGIVATPEEAEGHLAAVGARGARSEIQAAMSPMARARGSLDQDGLEILPGVHAPLADTTTRRALQTAFSQARTQYSSLGEVERIAQRFGATGPISPEAAGELGGPLSRLRAMVAQLQNTGVINPSEAPTIEAMLPDPRSMSQMTFDTLQGRLQSFRHELDSQVESALITRGTSPEEVRTALGLLHGSTGHAARRTSAATPEGSTPAVPGGSVMMRLPDGREVPIRADAVEEARRRGAEPI